MSWASAAQVRSYLGVTATTDDTRIQALVDACAQFIETYTNRSYEEAEYTETIDGTGKDEVMLGNYPVTSVSFVSIDGKSVGPVPTPNDFVTTGFMFDSGGVILQGGKLFSKGRRNVVISYTAGFAQIPADLVQAVVETAALKYKQGPQTGLSSKGLAGETTSYVLSDFPRSVQTLLNNYKRVVPHA